MLKPIQLTYLLTLIMLSALIGCSINTLSESNYGNTPSPGTKTAQASRAIMLATQSAEKVKTTYAANYAEAIATEDALQAYYEQRADWPLILQETFDDNRNDWPVEVDDGDLALISWKMANSKYQWDAMAKQAFIYWTHPAGTIVSDFYIRVEAQQIRGPDDGQFGLVFRLTDENNYYLYLIDQNKNYSLQLFNGGQWYTITYPTHTPVIQPGGVNQISVIGDGSKFRFYINDIFVNEETDPTLTSGNFGIAIGLNNPQDQANFEFDYFELRSPNETNEDQ